jgi:Uma2 family endonuclease
MSTTHLITATELLEKHSDVRCELIQGELHTMSPAGAAHGWVIARVTARIINFVEEHHLGYVFGAETGFVLERNPDTVRAPDIAFVRKDRISGRLGRRFLEFAPDLAIEVLSPSDTSSEVSAKAEQWLRCGSSQVWLIDPARETACICYLENDEFVSRSVQSLKASPLLPGFELQVKSLFEF